MLESAGPPRPISQAGPRGLTLPPTGTCHTLNLGFGALWLLFSTLDFGTKQAQDYSRQIAAFVPLSSPNLPLLPRSGNANTFQYPPTANIIRKINQLEEPPKLNTFPIPLTPDFGPL